MGKALIITGADFSANAVGQIDVPSEVIDITSDFVIALDTNMWSAPSGSNNRAGNAYNQPVDISNYILAGYNYIRITLIQDYWVLKALDIIPEHIVTREENPNRCVYGSDPTGQTWDDDSFSSPINAQYPYLYVCIKKDSNWSSTPNLADYIKIELLMA